MTLPSELAARFGLFDLFGGIVFDLT